MLLYHILVCELCSIFLDQGTVDVYKRNGVH